MAINKLYTIDYWKSQYSVYDLKKITLEKAVNVLLGKENIVTLMLHGVSIRNKITSKLLDTDVISDFDSSDKSKLVFNIKTIGDNEIVNINIPSNIIKLARLNVSDLKANFISSLRKSKNNAVCDPYNWRRIKKVISDLENLEEVNEIWGTEKWIFKGYVYEFTGKHKLSYSESQKSLLIEEHYRKETEKFERLKRAKGKSNNELVGIKRKPIPKNVRREVWRRDGGKCVKCGSREKLEYDHIIPISKGGSNTARNIELLCEKCNRSKGNRIDG